VLASLGLARAPIRLSLTEQRTPTPRRDRIDEGNTRMRPTALRIVVGGAAAAVLASTGLVGIVAAGAGKPWGPGHLYVSPHGVANAPDRSCASASFQSIQAAIEAAPIGGTVVVCPGTYLQSATIDKSLTLEGLPGATVDASGQPYGIGTSASWVTISGLTVENANSTVAGVPDDGIITAGFVGSNPVAADHVTIVHDVTENNVGGGIDLNSTSDSVARDDYSTGNAEGINVSDDLGTPASHNLVSGNVTDRNPGGCGIVLADHSGVGIFDNTIVGNVSNDNGLGTASAPDASSGSGIILAGSAGGVYDNLVAGNRFNGNGHAGVVLHAHAPGLNFSGNVIERNEIGINNQRTDYADLDTTGVYLGDVSPLTITVTNNLILVDYYGIFTAGTIDVTGSNHNAFFGATAPFGNTPTYGG
jgi:nitrous oxidase accessory protein NosD